MDLMTLVHFVRDASRGLEFKTTKLVSADVKYVYSLYVYNFIKYVYSIYVYNFIKYIYSLFVYNFISHHKCSRERYKYVKNRFLSGIAQITSPPLPPIRASCTTFFWRQKRRLARLALRNDGYDNDVSDRFFLWEVFPYPII